MNSTIKRTFGEERQLNLQPTLTSTPRLRGRMLTEVYTLGMTALAYVEYTNPSGGAVKSRDTRRLIMCADYTESRTILQIHHGSRSRD